jgi:hypothetical protein
MTRKTAIVVNAVPEVSFMLSSRNIFAIVPPSGLGAPYDVRGGLARGGQYVTQKWHHTPMFLPSARISCPRTLGGLLVVLSLLGACGEAHRPTGIGTRAVVTGIDGAD